MYTDKFVQQNYTHLVVINLSRSVDVDGLVELLRLRPGHMRLLW